MYLIFSPLFYINDVPHLGHQYTIGIAKSFSRLALICGVNHAVFVGTDEHGEKIYKSYLNYVVQKDLNQQKFSFVDYIEKRRDQFRKIFKTFPKYIEYNTNTNMHSVFVNEVFEMLLAKNKIVEGVYKGKYHVEQERYIDQIEFENLSDDEKNLVVDREEKGYYYCIKQNIEEIKKRLPKMLSGHYLEEAMQHCENAEDIFITRIQQGGAQHSIPVFRNNDLCFYVWFDAILYYISVIRSYNTALFKSCLFLGKDIIKFHTIMLQSLLIDMEVDVEMKLYNHGLIMADNMVKMSKSLQNTGQGEEMIQKHGDNVIGYLLSRNINQDINLEDTEVEGFKTFLKNNTRNLYKRYFSLFNEYKIKAQSWFDILSKIFYHPAQLELNKEAKILVEEINDFNPCRIYEILVRLSSAANKMIEEGQMWQHSHEKEADFFVVGNYVRVCMLLEYVLCIPGAEACLESIGEPVTSAASVVMKVTDTQRNIDTSKFNLPE